VRLRRRKFRAKVILQSTEWPVLIGLGPGLTFEMTADEARRLAWDLADALEAVQQPAGGE
jgi:hypothetical protein